MNIAKRATGYRGKVIADSFPFRDSRDNKPSTSRISYAAFIERRRENKYMYDVAHVLSPAMQAALAKHFSSLNSKPLGGAPRKLVAMGKKIYEEGVPETNVPACMACHGAEAKGQEAIPRLAGQLHDYIFNKLVNWNKERGQDPKHPDISAIMLPTSHNLTKSQIAEVAAYVSYLQ